MSMPAAEYRPDEGRDNKRLVVPATKRQTVILAASLGILSIMLALVAGCTLKYVEAISRRETRVRWEAPEGVSPKPGPPGFYYDRATQELVYAGVIDEEKKSQLISLFPTGT